MDGPRGQTTRAGYPRIELKPRNDLQEGRIEAVKGAIGPEEEGRNKDRNKAPRGRTETVEGGHPRIGPGPRNELQEGRTRTVKGEREAQEEGSKKDGQRLSREEGLERWSNKETGRRGPRER